MDMQSINIYIYIMLIIIIIIYISNFIIIDNLNKLLFIIARIVNQV